MAARHEDLAAGQRRTRWLWAALLTIPTITVLGVAISWFVLGREQPVVAARVYLGPAPKSGALGDQRVAFRAQVLSSFSGIETPKAIPVTTTVSAFGRRQAAEVLSDANGVVSVNMSFDQTSTAETAGPIIIRLLSGAHTLAEGEWKTEPFVARRQAGRQFLAHTAATGARVALSLSRGVLAIPFDNELIVELSRDGTAIAGAPISLSFDGAQILGDSSLKTDGRGRVSVPIRTTSHQVSVRLQFEATAGTVESQQLDLPVVAGAMHASLADSVLTVHAPVPRDVAYVNVVDEQRTLWVATLPLTPSAVGATGNLRLPPLVGPLWALTSSESDLQSMALVGWPVGDPAERPTLERRDQLIIDGFLAARVAESARRSRMRDAGLFGALLATLVEVTLLIRTLQLQNAGRMPHELSGAVRSGHGATVVAVVLLMLGFAALALLVSARY